MKKIYPAMQATCLVVLSTIMLNSCVKDKGMKKTRIYTPVFETLSTVRKDIKSSTPQDVLLPGKMVILGNTIYVTELGKGIHIIDNSNPASPVNKGFINIPGNEDIAIKGNTLYADCFTDLMVIDIKDPSNVSLKTHLPGIFPDRQWVMGYNLDNNVITDWVARDTVMDIEVTEGQGIWRNGSYYTAYNGGVIYPQTFNLYAAASSDKSYSNAGATGVTGSMSRFAIVNNYLYSVTATKVNTIDITQEQAPSLKGTLTPADQFGTIETIYPFKNKLFIGSQTSMFIYNINNPASPSLEGTFKHARVCDPVIADDNYAFVTLRSGGGTICHDDVNELDVLDIKDISNVSLIKSYALTNPRGLSKDGNTLIVCDGADGLKIFNAADVNNITLLQTIPMAETFDVICYNNIAIVSAKDGIYQYSYAGTNNAKLLSKIALKQ